MTDVNRLPLMNKVHLILLSLERCGNNAEVRYTKVLAEELLRLLDQDTPTEAKMAWRSTTIAYTRFITDARYQRLRPGYKKWYEPIVCDCMLDKPIDKP